LNSIRNSYISDINLIIIYNKCRERGITYKSKMQAKFCWTVNDGPENSEIKNLGYLPIMVRVSKLYFLDFFLKKRQYNRN